MRSTLALIAWLLVFCGGIASAAEQPARDVAVSAVLPGKLIYKAGETVTITATYSAAASFPATMQLWIERELSPAFKAAETALAIRSGAQQASITWTADRNVFGHRAVVRFVDAQGRALGEGETLFDVTPDWQHVMRVGSVGANRVAAARFGDAQILEFIRKMRAAQLNTFQPWTFAPEPYNLAPAVDEWPYQHRSSSTATISKERLLAWGKALRANGFKYLAYDETSAIAGPSDLRVFEGLPGARRIVAPYFSDRGMFNPNTLAVAPLLADQLSRSIRMFGWDGIVLDSSIQANIVTSEGYDAGGRKITALAPGETGYRYLAQARARALALNPGFRFFAQNASWVSGAAVKEAPDGVYPAMIANAERLKIREYSKVVDMYTAEIDAFHEPRDGRYPLTYEKMSVALNSLIEVLGRPLLAFAFLTPPGTEKSIAFIRPYFALHLASRAHVQDHFIFDNGAAGDNPGSAAAQQFIRYNAFLARYSYYLHDPELRWMTDAGRRFSVSASRPVFWERTVYRRTLGAGGERIVIDLLNLPSNGRILDQTEIPPVARDITLRLNGGRAPKSVVWVSADDDRPHPVSLQPAGAAGQPEYRLPPLVSWALVVIEN